MERRGAKAQRFFFREGKGREDFMFFSVLFALSTK